MTLPAVDTWNLRGEKGQPYKVGPHCSHPACVKYADHAHHIVRRSQLGGDYPWVVIDGNVYGNLTGLCVEHHNEVTGRIGGHVAAIRLIDGIFWWCLVEPDSANGVVDYARYAPIEPQPPNPESAQRASKSVDPGSEHCPFCGQHRRRRSSSPATAGRRRRKSWLIKVPDDAEDGAEVLDTLIDDLALVVGVDPTATGRYYVVAMALVFAQQQKPEFVQSMRGTG